MPELSTLALSSNHVKNTIFDLKKIIDCCICGENVSRDEFCYPLCGHFYCIPCMLQMRSTQCAVCKISLLKSVVREYEPIVVSQEPIYKAYNSVESPSRIPSRTPSRTRRNCFNYSYCHNKVYDNESKVCYECNNL